MALSVLTLNLLTSGSTLIKISPKMSRRFCTGLLRLRTSMISIGSSQKFVRARKRLSMMKKFYLTISLDILERVLKSSNLLMILFND